MAKVKTATPKKDLPDGWLGAALLLLVTVLVYLPAMRCGYIWDDDKLLTENPAIKGANGLYTIWFTRQLNDWVPLTSTTFWLEWHFWKLNPIGFHVSNILLHAINSILLWRVLRFLRLPGAWAAALLFAVHPVCVASVAWIAERKNTLSMAFYLASLLLYLRFDAEPQKRKWYIFSLATFLLALLAKTSVGILPLVILLCLWWQRGRIAVVDFLRVVPFFLLTAVCVSMSVWVQNRAMESEIVLAHDPLLVRLIGGSWAVWFYLWKIFLPIHLTMIYPRWTIRPGDALAYVPGLLLTGMFLVFWRCRKTWGRGGLFALGYFIIALGPVLGPVKLTFFDFSRVADHLQYLALPGILTLAAVVLRKYFWIVAAACCVLTWQHQKIFSNSETLWLDNVAQNPASWTACRDLGVIANKRGDSDGAITWFRQSIAAQPNFPTAYVNLGIALAKKNQLEEAMKYFRQAVKINPQYALAHVNLATGLVRQNQFDEAIQEYEEAIKLKPNFANAHYGLAEVLAVKGRRAEAIAHYQEALRLQPVYPEAERQLRILSAPR